MMVALPRTLLLVLFCGRWGYQGGEEQAFVMRHYDDHPGASWLF